MVICDFEDNVQDTGLRFVEIEQAGEEQRTHVRNRGAERMSVFAEEIPEFDWRAFEGKVGEREISHTLRDLWMIRARPRESRQVAFNICHENRHA